MCKASATRSNQARETRSSKALQTRASIPLSGRSARGRGKLRPKSLDAPGTFRRVQQHRAGGPAHRASRAASPIPRFARTRRRQALRPHRPRTMPARGRCAVRASGTSRLCRPRYPKAAAVPAASRTDARRAQGLEAAASNLSRRFSHSGSSARLMPARRQMHVFECSNREADDRPPRPESAMECRRSASQISRRMAFDNPS